MKVEHLQHLLKQKDREIEMAQRSMEELTLARETDKKRTQEMQAAADGAAKQEVAAWSAQAATATSALHQVQEERRESRDKHD